MVKFCIVIMGLIPFINCSPLATTSGLTGPIEELCIQVGDGLWDGTNSRVSACIYGTNVGSAGSCCTNQLNGHGDDFQHGDNDCYAVEHGLGECAGMDLGTVLEVKMHIDGSDALCDLRVRVHVAGGVYTECDIDACVDETGDQSCNFPDVME
eukprot:GFUD01021935.1.p1 GENE.GFUD01021935.1~~GFUD01021935.1.p1  ORF type:complete len:167 (-),score=14.38 GFUD01021935.1:18-476(-)